MTLNYLNNCVNWPRHDVNADGGLCDMEFQGRPITRRTFLKKVNRNALRVLERSLGYAKHPKHGLTMAADYHVQYYRSKLHGKTVYYFVHSAIEYVFADTKTDNSGVSATQEPAHYQLGQGQAYDNAI